MHVAILHTHFMDPGGVGNYYSKIRGKFSCRVTHFPVGSRPGEKGLIQKIFRFFNDYVSFRHLLINEDIDLVMLNPSLDFKGLFRDALFLKIAKHYKKKCVVFIRGWHESTERIISKRGSKIFRDIYGNADHFIVLSKNFVPILRKWGIEKPVSVERTIVDEDQVKDLQIQELLDKRQRDKKRRVLFISRILKEKGIYETIDAIEIANKSDPRIELFIAGTGPEYESVKGYVAQKGTDFIKILGYVRGEAKTNLMKQCHILCHPTYGEGMPNTVIECLAFGLPVITCPVGGIPDFFEHEKNGFLTEDRRPENLAHLILKLFNHDKLYREMAMYNFEMGKTFYASKAASRLEAIFKTVLASS